MVNQPSTTLPAGYTTTVVLRDGSSLLLRPIRPDDYLKLLRLFSRLSPQTVYLRFHRAVERLTEEEARRFSDLDYVNDFALVGTVGTGAEERIVAVGRLPGFRGKTLRRRAFLSKTATRGKASALSWSNGSPMWPAITVSPLLRPMFWPKKSQSWLSSGTTVSMSPVSLRRVSTISHFR